VLGSYTVFPEKILFARRTQPQTRHESAAADTKNMKRTKHGQGHEEECLLFVFFLRFFVFFVPFPPQAD